MVKTYLRYEPEGTPSGVIVSPTGHIAYDGAGQLAICPSLENATVYNLRTHTCTGVLAPSVAGFDSHVTVIKVAPRSSTVAVGYADGSIRLYALDTIGVLKPVSVLHGHSAAVLSLCFDADGSVLYSASADTTIIGWDMVAQSGQFRLRGHRDAVTDLVLLESRNLLISGSKDTLIKVWDLQTQHSVHTVVGIRNEIWSLDVDPEGRRLVVAGAGSEIHVYDVSATSSTVEPVAIGVLTKSSREHAGRVQFHPSGRWFLVQSMDKILDVFMVRSAKDIRRKQKRREKRQEGKESAADSEGKSGDQEGDQGDEGSAAIRVDDEFVLWKSVREQHKIRSAAWCPAQSSTSSSSSSMKKGSKKESGDLLKILVAFQNNSIAELKLEADDGAVERSETIDEDGHRSDIRAIALSADSSILCSSSKDMLKIWFLRERLECFRTIESGFGLCILIVPGNKHVLLGTKSGDLELYEIASGRLLEKTHAHEGPIWSLTLRPDQRSFATGSGDKEIKFWDFELVSDEEYSSSVKRLSFSLEKTLKMADDVLCVKFSPDGKFLAIGLLDCTIKVFFADSLKFYLSLYGHKLPVLCLDISSDSTLLISGSADKNVKIWGLDFGDCHRSLFAHQDSVTAVQFVPQTHLFFTTSKDRLIKYWDADRFQHVQTLTGHHSEVWSMAVSAEGGFVYTGSNDRSIRTFIRTEEPLFIEEEREREREKDYERSLIDQREFSLEALAQQDSAATVDTAPGAKRTIDSLKGSEKIVDSLELVESEHLRIADIRAANAAKGVPTNPLLLGLSPNEYLLHTLRSIRPSELQQSLQLLPFTHALHLLKYLDILMSERPSDVELVARCAMYLIRIHQRTIVSNGILIPILRSLQHKMKTFVGASKHVIGINLSALSFVKRSLEAREEVSFFNVDTVRQARDAAKKSKKSKLKR